MPQAPSAIHARTLPVPSFRSFEEFWPYYLRAHAKPETRAMHILGTTFGLLGIAGWLAGGRKRDLAAGILASYGSAWLGHYAFEGNAPAAFEKPLWSLQADLRLYRLWFNGQLDAEVARVLKTKLGMKTH